MSRHPYELLHVASGFVLQVQRDDLGHPDRPGLWRRLLAQRPYKPGDLQCLYCVDIGNGIQWVTLCERTNEWEEPGPDGAAVTRHRITPYPKHLSTSVKEHEASTHDHDLGVEIITERTLRWDTSLTAAREVASVDGTYRADAVITSGDRRYGFEWQLQGMNRARAIKRDDVRRLDGLPTMWGSTNRKKRLFARWIPSAIVEAPDATYREAGKQLYVLGQARVLESDRCGRRGRCPHGRRGCSALHLYAVPVRVAIDELLAGATLGSWRAVGLNGGGYQWMTDEHARLWVAEYGEPTRPLIPTVISRAKPVHSFEAPNATPPIAVRVVPEGKCPLCPSQHDCCEFRSGTLFCVVPFCRNPHHRGDAK